MNPTPLTYLDGQTLMSTVLPPIRFVVDKLLPQGLHILAGAPKVGKSWLALWLCLCVAKGEPVWNFPTLADRCTTETMRSVMDTMKQSMDDGEIPPTETVRSFIQHPEQPTDLTAFQQALAMDNLLEQAEVNFRTLCDLLRYHYWKQAGAVSSVDEFLELFR